MHLGIGGHIASGKSSLAGILREGLGISSVDFRSDNKENIESYINDIHSHPIEWSMEAQIAFLVAKAAGIRRAVEMGQDFVIDRTIEEDVFVFARWFYHNKQMTNRSWDTYIRVWEEISISIPINRINILCHCEKQTMLSRLEARKRDYQKYYKINFLEFIREEELKLAMRSLIPTFILNTDINDVFINRQGVIAEIKSLVIDNTGPISSNMLFPETDNGKILLKYLKPINERAEKYDPSSINKKRRISSFSKNRKQKLYLAAPFTGKEVQGHSVENINQALFPDEFSVDVIPLGGYRFELESLALIFQQMKFDVCLPHRDINKWGSRSMTGKQVAEECIDQVLDSDIVVALLGKSYGAHVEVGSAIGYGIPIVVITLDETGNSFFGEGLSKSKFVEHLTFNNMEELLEMPSENWLKIFEKLLGLAN